MSTKIRKTTIILIAITLQPLFAKYVDLNADELKGELIVTGSSTIAPVISDIGKRFEEFCDGCRVDVQSGGSSRGITDVRKGLADIGMVSRDLKAAEDDLTSFPLARDGIAMIVNQSTAIDALSDDQIRRIYNGEFESWDAVGAAKGPIIVVNKAEGRSTLDVFLEYFDLEINQIEPDVIIGENEQGIKYVASAPGSIGYVSIGAAIYAVDMGLPLTVLSLGPAEATIENVANGGYAAVRTLNLIAAKQPEGLVC